MIRPREGRSRYWLSESRGTTVAVICVAVLAPFILNSNFWLGILVFGWMYVVASVGLTMLFGYAGQISFGQGAFYGVGAYTSALLTLDRGWPVWAGILAAVFCSGTLGLVLAYPILRLHGLSLAMGTLAYAVVAYTLFQQLSVTNGTLGLAGLPSPSIGEIRLDTPFSYYWLVMPVGLIVLALTSNLARSHVGRALHAVGVSEVAAASNGVNAVAYKTRVFSYAAGLAGLAGALYAHFVTYISSENFGVQLSILFVVMVAIGGLGSIWGAVVGSFALAIIPQLLAGSLAAQSTLLYGVMLTIVFMWAPGGIVGVIKSGSSYVRSRRHAFVHSESQ